MDGLVPDGPTDRESLTTSTTGAWNLSHGRSESCGLVCSGCSGLFGFFYLSCWSIRVLLFLLFLRFCFFITHRDCLTQWLQVEGLTEGALVDVAVFADALMTLLGSSFDSHE